MEDDMWMGLSGMTSFERWKWASFSFRGAIRRQGYWGYSFLNVALFMIPLYVLIFVAISTLSSGVGLPLTIIVGALGVAFFVVLIWQGLALGVKRCRSCGWPVGLVALNYAPYVGGIFGIVIGCIPQKPESHKPANLAAQAEVFA